MKRENNPRYQVGQYDESEAQFHAVVQGIYESLVRKELGLKSTAPFKNRAGSRIDEQGIIAGRFTADDLRQLLSNAFAIATRQGQRLGTLQRGTQKATAKGRAKSRKRAKDKAHLEANIQDYETTLGLVRKGGAYRIVKRRGRFYIQPHEDAFNSKGYKTERGAKGVLTRYLNQLGDPGNLPSIDNPRPRQGSMQFSDRDIRWLKREERKSQYRKKPRTKGVISDYARKLSYAEGTGALQRWRSEGKNEDQIRDLVARQKLSGKMAPGMEDLQQQKIEADVIIQYAYLPEMMSQGQPYLIYRRAPIAAFYTIELFGPKYKFQLSVKGQQTLLLDRKRWRSASWAGLDGFSMKEDVEYDNIRDGVKKGVRFKSLPYITCAYYPGSRLNTYNGFRPDVVGKATRNVVDAYGSWFDEHAAELRKADPTLTYPDDCLEPIYDIDVCKGNKISVINPIQHFGVFLRALVSLLELKDALQLRGKGNYLNMNNVIEWIEKNGLTDAIKKALESEDIQLDASLLFSDTDGGVRSQTITKEEQATINEIENYVEDVWAPLIEHVRGLDIDSEEFRTTANAEASAIEKAMRQQKDTARINWLNGVSNIEDVIVQRYGNFLSNYSQSMKDKGLTAIPKLKIPDYDGDFPRRAKRVGRVARKSKKKKK